MKAARALIDLLRSEGIAHVFGNPGTTELPFMDELARAPDLSYFLGLHESVAVSMADGLARATGEPSFVNLHIASGLANGLSNVLNAKRARTPMVVTAGQQDRRHILQDPMLGGDLVALAQGAFKSAVEVTRVEDLPVLMRRAFMHARAAPSGPVFVSLPVDVLEEELPGALPPRSEVRPPGAAQGVEQAAAILLEAQAPAIVAGDGVGRDGAVAELARVAEALGATVFGEPMYDAVDFPATHSLYAGMLPPVNASIHGLLDGHDVVFLVGSHAFSPHYHTPGPAIPPDAVLVQVDPDPGELGRNYPVACGLQGGVRATLSVLGRLLEGRCPAAGERMAAAEARREGERAAGARDGRPGDDPAAAAQALVAALPEDTVLVEEAITTGLHVRRAFAADRPGSFHHSVGGALGWGIGAGMGIKLARPDAPVVAVVGDGTAMYSIQGLWSAARYELGVLVVVMNNREYRACKQGVDQVVVGEPTGYVGMDLAPPAIDFPGLAEALGVRGRRAEGAGAIAAEVEEALASGGPALLEIPIAGMEAAGARGAESRGVVGAS